MKNLKDKRVVLYKPKTAVQGGITNTKYVPLHPGAVWAYMRQLSAKEYFAAQAVQQKETVLFMVNHRRDISTQCYVCYMGVFYNITRVDAFEGYKGDLRLYADQMANQPKNTDVLPYE